MKIIGMLIARNEAGRFLSGALDTLFAFCDRVIVLDDGSTDNTPDVCRERGAAVYLTPERGGVWNEPVQRKRLWEYATAEAQPGDWIISLDADESMPYVHRQRLRKLLENVPEDCDGAAFTLYDMWSVTHYRQGWWWKAHQADFTICCRFRPGQWKWLDQVCHCGRLPVGAVNKYAKLPIDVQHWAYSTDDQRQYKAEFYRNIDPDAKYGHQGQYDSILDPSPNLIEYKTPKIKILMGGPVHESPDMFREHLECLRGQILPDWVSVHKFFIFHECSETIKDLLQPNETYMLAENIGIAGGLGYHRDETTHHHNQNNINALSVMRNYMLRITAAMKCDFLLMTDADVMIRPDTLMRLIEAGKEVIFQLYWTKWQETDDHYMPQVWDYDAYTYKSETMLSLNVPCVMRCGMGGACSLISLEAINKGISYDPIYNVSWTQYGEDRAFCVRCACAGIELWVDTHNTPWHLYRQAEFDQYLQEKEAGTLWHSG